MKIKKFLTLIFVLMMIVSIMLIVASCAPEGEEDVDGGQDNSQSGAIPRPSDINKGAIFENIAEGLLNTGALQASQEKGKCFVSSSYNIQVGGVNTEMIYEANYDMERKQDSEILLRVIDYAYQIDKLFVYYVNNNLYYSIEGNKNKIEGFGGTSSFSIFYEVITQLDLGSILFDSKTVDTITSMSILAETKNITRRTLEVDDKNVATKENITIKNINLDTSKDIVNNAIQDALVPLGKKLDPLTQLLLGFKFSALAAFKVERFTVRQLQAVLETSNSGEKKISDFKLVFDDDEEGEPEWGSIANDYYLSIEYSTDNKKGVISLSKEEDPKLNLYRRGTMGDIHLTGYLDIPSLDAHLHADLKLDLNAVDNEANRIKIEFRDMSENQDHQYAINEEVIAAYYKNGILYADFSGFLRKYVGDTVDLESLNFPQLKFSSLNVSQLFSDLIRYGVNVFTSGMDLSIILPEEEQTASMLHVFLSKLRSENDKVILRIDDELVSGMFAGEMDRLLDMMGDLFGLSSQQIDLLIKVGLFDNSYLEFSYDTKTQEIKIVGFAGGKNLFSLSLYLEQTEFGELDIIFPAQTYFDGFSDFEQPDVINVHFDMLISTQKVNSVDFSSFMGLFIGDVSGKNTSMTISPGTNNGIRLVGEIATLDSAMYINMQALRGSEILVRVNTNPSNPLQVLVDNKILGVKYVMPSQALLDGLNKLAGGKSTLNFENIVLNLPPIAKEANYARNLDYFTFKLFPYTEGRVSYDPVKRITGVANLIADLDFYISFDLPDFNENVEEYLIPSIDSIPEITYKGMYDAVWKDKVTVAIGEFSKDFYLTFDGDSAVLETGRYEYHPTTYLFGKPVTYTMYFSDQVNGTRVIRGLYQPFLQIDPADIKPMPDLIQVVYDDGTLGLLNYRIIGFPYNNTNINQIYKGISPTEFEIVLGEGSIAETKFDIIVEVLNCTIVVSEDRYYNDVPIVARVVIDPYDYAIKKAIANGESQEYNPIKYREETIYIEDGEAIPPTALELVFESHIKSSSGETYRKEYIENFDWNFDFSLIRFSGGEYTVIAKYKGLKIALEVVVLAKVYSHVQINDEVRGYYTVDALRLATYNIPMTSIYEDRATEALPKNEIRMYFESGHFRIIGNQPEGFEISNEDRDWFDGFYPGGLDWSFKVANQVTIDRAIYPLDNGRTNKTEAYFGDDIAGKQKIELYVTCPTRVIGTLPDTLLSISEVSYDSTGQVIAETIKREAVKISYAAFSNGAPLGSYFEFDPYSQKASNTKLPEEVWLDVIYRGRVQRLAYDVTWLTNLTGAINSKNIIDSEGNILNAFAEEEYFVVYGRVGTATNFQILTMIIHNKSGAYERVVMLDENEDLFQGIVEVNEGDGTIHYYINNLNPYEPLILPKYFRLQFSEISGIPEAQYATYWLMSNGQEATAYDFPYQGGSFVTTTRLSADTDSGMLDQIIELNLHFLEKIVVSDKIYVESSVMTPEHILLENQEGDGGGKSLPYIPVNPYSIDSYTLYELLSQWLDDNPQNGSSSLSVGVGFEDMTEMSSGIDIEWENLEELLSVLKSPLGSKDLYNEADYYADFIKLRGKIAPGTLREQRVSMAFRVDAKVIRDFSYLNLNNEYTVKDDYDVIPVHITQSLKRIEYNIETMHHEYVGENTINIILNKPYMIKGPYIDPHGEMKMGACTPSQYIEYLFSRISIGFEEDLPAEFAMVFELREDFDDILFFKKQAEEYLDDEDVTITSNLASIRFIVKKLGEGSCEQSFEVTVHAIRDYIVTTEFTDRIETFDKNGVPIYNVIDGYVIPDTFAVEYVHSGVVEYEGLVWHSLDYVAGESRAINPGDVVEKVPYEFFRFRSGRIITLEAKTHDGTSLMRRLSFNKKDVREENYNTQSTGVYDIKDGILTISNVYQIYPVEGLEERLSSKIVPKKTVDYFSEIDMSFELDAGWIPDSAFAMTSDPSKFDPEILANNINYSGLAKTLFATGTITGYNGEKQTIKLYIQVSSLDSGGRISNASIGLENSLAVIDPYFRPLEENGVLALPKDITIRFGGISPDQAVWTFGDEYDIQFKIKNHVSNDYETISQITYNKFGHTLSQAYGGQNDRLLIKVVLPDGNDSCSFEIQFLRRELSKVFYSTKITNGTNTQDVMVEGRYFIDPYDSSTFALPFQAEFEYLGYQERTSMPINLVPFSQNHPFVLTAGNRYTLGTNAINYVGGEYYFYGYLHGVGSGDSPQYFILTVIVLNRTVEVEPIEITENNGVFEFSGVDGKPNPFEGLVSDIPSSLANATFNNLIKTDEDEKISTEISQVVAHIKAMPGNGNVSISHYDFVGNSMKNIYQDYTGQPTLPNIEWYVGNRALVDDDILVTGNFLIELIGVIGYGEINRTKGQEVSLKISAEQWTFMEVMGITNYVIEFNMYSNKSIADEFGIKFSRDASTPPFEISSVFYPIDKIGDDGGKKRRVIDWGGVNPASPVTSALILRNMFKTSPVNIITTEGIYNLDYQQIAVDEISFGFGDNEGYNVSSSVYITIDPLNPIIPTKALAKGVNPNQAIQPPEIVDIGEVTINWINKNSESAGSIYNIPIGGGKRTVEVEIIDSIGEITPFTVQVYYLNRTVKRVYTSIAGYSRLPADAGEYLLMERGDNIGGQIPSTRSYYFDLDPVNPNIYTQNASVVTNLKYIGERAKLQQSLYKLPTSVRLEFYNVHVVNSSMPESVYTEALNKLGHELTLIDIDWVISRDIELISATSSNPITSKIRGYKAKYFNTISNKEITSEKLSFIAFDSEEQNANLIENSKWLGTSLNINLTTVDRMVQYTSVSQGVVVDIGGVLTHYQEAEENWFIDPYDIKLPQIVDVYFKNQAMPVRYGETTPINWIYNASYLNKPEIISGSIVTEQPNGERFMTLMAEFRAYGTKVAIQFKIKARNIDTKVVLPNGQVTTEPLKGGTIFVLKGIPIEEQLPSKLYYRFSYPDGTTEIAGAPLSFGVNTISGLSTAIAVTDSEFGGTYSNVTGTLGTIDDNNIIFNVIVIDPKLYGISVVSNVFEVGGVQTTVFEYQRINFLIDVIAVRVGRGNTYAPGEETSLLPTRIIVTNDGEYIEIEGIEYDIPNMRAIISCNYTFLSFSDNAMLYGNSSEFEDNAKKLTVKFEVPISTYQYTSVEVTEAVFHQNSISVPLGGIIKASDLPTTVNGIRPLWVLDNVNTNKAGRYIAKCYFNNAYGAIIEGSYTVIVQKRVIKPEEVVIDKRFLERVYTGEAMDIAEYITFANFLRADGKLGQIQGYTVQYSINGGATWISTQPVNVPEPGSPNYMVRILITDDDDYNISGSVAFRLNITPAQVDKESIYFHKGDKIPQSGEVTFEYNGAERVPAIEGIPQGLNYQLAYAEYIEGEIPNYSGLIRPINAGAYSLRITFSENQRNYNIEEGLTYSIIIIITKKNVDYSLEHELQYTGESFHVPINGLPSPIPGGVTITYTYYDILGGYTLPAGSELINAREYRVSVAINGGLNYPSYNIPGASTNYSLLDQTVIIYPKKVKIDIGNLSTNYLDPLLPLNSLLRIVDADDISQNGLQNKDEIGIFGNIEVVWSGGTLTNRHMVGTYELIIANLNSVSHQNYEIMGEIRGEYTITAALPNTLVIDNKAQLDQVLSLIKDGDTIRLYLRAGNYGTISLNKNAAVSIVGSYNLLDGNEDIAVIFDKITVTKGALLVDIVKMYAKASTTLIEVGKDVASLTVNRCQFIDIITEGASRLITTNSSVVKAVSGFKGKVYMENAYVLGFTKVIYLETGSVEVSSSTFKYSIDVIHVMSGNVAVDNSIFKNTRNSAIRIDHTKAEVSIFDNEFISNSIAIQSAVPMRNDIGVQNIFRENATNIQYF